MIICANPNEQFLSYQKEIEDAILRVLRGNRYILGKEVEKLESEFADYIGCSDAIGVANGTDALELALRAYDIGLGDEVITVSHTAVATVAAIESVGATPVLIDIDPNFFTIEPNQLPDVLSKKTKAVIAVHLYGQAVNLDEIKTFCDTNNLILIEDVSQAHGARWKGKRLGSIGHVSCFSCYPTKNLGAVGDAGLITTNDKIISQKIRMLREYGWKDRYISNFAGRNSRLDEIQAAVLRVKLRYLDADNEKRNKIAKKYDCMLSNAIDVPSIRPGAEHVYHLYVVKVPNRDQLIKDLNCKDIYPGIHYSTPIHLQPAYSQRIMTHKSMKVTERTAEIILSLPIYPEFSKSEDVAEVVLKSVVM